MATTRRFAYTVADAFKMLVDQVLADYQNVNVTNMTYTVSSDSGYRAIGYNRTTSGVVDTFIYLIPTMRATDVMPAPALMMQPGWLVSGSANLVSGAPIAPRTAWANILVAARRSIWTTFTRATISALVTTTYNTADSNASFYDDSWTVQDDYYLARDSMALQTRSVSVTVFGPTVRTGWVVRPESGGAVGLDTTPIADKLAALNESAQDIAGRDLEYQIGTNGPVITLKSRTLLP